LYDRYDDAVRAVRGAIKHGVLAGGGSTLFHTRDKFLFGDVVASNRGEILLYDSLAAPLGKICENASQGVEEGELLYNKIAGDMVKYGRGYNFRTKEYCNYIEWE